MSTGGARGLLKTGVLSLGLKGLSLVFAYFLLIVAARSMTLEDFGWFAYAMGAAQIGFVVLSGGFGKGSLRYLPKFRTEEDTSSFDRFFWTGVLSIGTMSLIALVIAAFGGTITATVGSAMPSAPLTLALFVCAAGLLSLNEMLSNTLRAQGATITAILLRDLAFRAIFVIGALILATLTLNQALSLYAGALAISAVIALWIVTRRNGIRLRRPDTAHAATHSASMRNFWAADVLLTATSHIDEVIIGLFCPPEDIALYSVAKRTSILLGFFLMTANFVLAPQITAAFTRNQRERLQRLLSFAVGFAGAPTLLIFAGFLLFGEEIMRLFGEAFVPGTWMLIVLGFTQTVNSLFGATKMFLMQVGGEAKALAIYFRSLIVGSAAITLGAWLWGIEGAAYGFLFSTILWNLWIYIVIRRSYGFDTSILSTPKVLFAYLSKSR